MDPGEVKPLVSRVNPAGVSTPAMIGAAAYYEYCRGVRHGYDLNAVPNLKLGERA